MRGVDPLSRRGEANERPGMISVHLKCARHGPGSIDRTDDRSLDRARAGVGFVNRSNRAVRTLSSWAKAPGIALAVAEGPKALSQPIQTP